MTDDGAAGDAFSRVYETDHWSGGSGVGSRSDLNAGYAAVVRALTQATDVESVVDAGCGDWQFSRHIDWSSVRYHGVDVVESVIEANRQQFGCDGVEFSRLDFSQHALPPADLLLCKDVLQHWPNSAISSFLQRNLGRYRYALITNDVASVHCRPERQNADIAFGEWRVIDLAKPPFSQTGRVSIDLDYVGEWTKRATLFSSMGVTVASRFRKHSGLRNVQRIAH